ncbi:MAG TPA: DsbA family protein [Solirubrobacteraceae bacterium]|nr:DsbA family protein [Solirubrobacteraceae bacterium]
MAATFYFDLGSPYAYLAAERIEALLGEDVAWQPLSLGALFKLNGRSSWSLAGEQPRRQGIGEVERRARSRGLAPLRWPEPWPGNYLMAMRAATFACASGCGREFALRAFRDAFVRGRDLSLPEHVLAAAAAVGLDPERVRAATGEPAVKQALREATDAAHALGVLGVPTVAVPRAGGDGAELFWGDDRLERAAALLSAHSERW